MVVINFNLTFNSIIQLTSLEMLALQNDLRLVEGENFFVEVESD